MTLGILLNISEPLEPLSLRDGVDRFISEPFLVQILCESHLQYKRGSWDVMRWLLVFPDTDVAGHLTVHRHDKAYIILYSFQNT